MGRLFLTGALALSVLFSGGFAASAHEYSQGWCDSGFTGKAYRAGGKWWLECHKWENRPHRVYYNYNPCAAPGVYRVNDEVPTGRHRGRDRCTAYGVSGPALTCGLGKRVEIVRGGKDKCYVLEPKTLVKGRIRTHN
jgi:hypothetical protein